MYAMFSVREIVQRFKSQVPHLPLAIIVGTMIITVGIVSFTLGWVARSTHTQPGIQISETTLPVTAQVAGARSAVFVASKHSDKYHYRWCSGAQRINAGNKIYFATRRAAHQAGYEPAENCPGLKTKGN